jgi:putative transposase
VELLRPADAEIGDRRDVFREGQDGAQVGIVEDADPAVAEAFGARDEPEVLNGADRGIEIGVAIVGTVEHHRSAVRAVAADADVERRIENVLELQGTVERQALVLEQLRGLSPIVDPRLSYGLEDVVRTLEGICGQVGYPKTIRVDQGSEFFSHDLDLWTYANGVALDFSRPGEPTDNAFIEAFNSKFRSESPNAHWFMNLDDARSKMEDWRRYYYEERPRSGIGQNTSIQLQNFGGATSPSPA